MAASSRRALWIIAVPLVLLAVIGLVCVLVVRSFLQGLGSLSLFPEAPLVQYDTPRQLSKVSVPHHPNSLLWSPDGAYLVGAAGGWSRGDDMDRPSEVYVVDANKGVLVKTLEARGTYCELSFSPNGKFLVVANRPSLPPGPHPVELVVFDVPSFTAKLTAKTSDSKNGFLAVAWAPDGKALFAIDGLGDSGSKSAIRRWSVSAFTEEPALREPQKDYYAALAVSPDGNTLAVAEKSSYGEPVRVHLFDLEKGKEKFSFAGPPAETRPPALGFTPDGKVVGFQQGGKTSWWDLAGKPAKPEVASFALEPPAPQTVSREGLQAQGETRYARLVGESWGKPKNYYGTFVVIKDPKAEKSWTWRLSGVTGAADTPPVAFSPDGLRLASAYTEYDEFNRDQGTFIIIWAAPE